MIKVTRDDIIYMHEMLADETGGSRGLKDEGLLDSALNSPFHTFGGEDLFTTIEEKAATLGHSIISNHPFVDGNKRIGILAMMTFLEMNDTKFEITDVELVDLTIGLADGSISKDALVDIIIDYSTPVLGDDVDEYFKRRGLDTVLTEKEYEDLKESFINDEIAEDDITGIIGIYNFKTFINNNRAEKDTLSL